MGKFLDPFDCARRGDVDFFKTVSPDILLEARDELGRSVLTVAAEEGQLDCCEVIVERCTPLLYHQDKYKCSVLHDVAAYPGDKNLENIMRFLITADSEADLEDGVGGKIPNKRLLTMQDFIGRTALHLAVSSGNHWATKLLLEAGRDFELLRMVDEDGRTCLHPAAWRDDHLSAELIIRARPDNEFLKMTTTRSNQTALHIAAFWGSLAVAKLLLEADHSNDLLAVVDSHQQTALHVAVKRGKLDMVKLICEADLDKQLLSMPDEDGNTPLLLAMDKAATARDEAGSVSEDICKLLLDKDPNQCTRRTGDMGLAASYGLNSVVKDIIPLCPDCINTVDFHGQNFLHIAFKHGHPNAVKHFLESKDIDVVGLLNTQDKDGNTPLHLAVSNGNVEVVGLILEAHPISARIANISQQTPYVMAMEKILSDEYDEAHSESDSKIIRILLEKGPEQCKIRTGDMQWTYLHRATSRGHLSIIKDIIQLCPDCLKLEDTQKQTFIHIAAKHGFVNVVDFILKSKEIEETMLNAQDKDGNTPLHIAAVNKSQEATLCLLYDARVNKEIENNKKEKAIDLINFPYDEAKARVYSLGHQSDLKDQRSFDLLVAALIATVSFTAGITVPGGYISDGDNKGSAVLLKATTFKVFVISNSFALLFSLYTVFLNFSTRRLLKEDDIYYESSMGKFRTRLLLKKKDMIYQLKTATLCTLSAIYAMVVAFITGSYAVLANSDELAIAVCVSSCFFLILASRATWTMAMQYWRSKLTWTMAMQYWRSSRFNLSSPSTHHPSSPNLSSPPLSTSNKTTSLPKPSSSTILPLSHQIPNPPPQIEDFPSLPISQKTQSSNLANLEQAKSNGFWSSLFKTKPPSAGSEELRFYEPNLKNGAMEFDEQTLEEGAKEWEDKVVGFFIDKKLPYSVVKPQVEKKWKLSGGVDVALDGETYYFTFNNPQDREQVIGDGSFYMLGKLFIIRPWTREFEENGSKIHRAPLWVKIHKVPKHLWNAKGLSKIASFIGKPLFLDKYTESKSMLSFVRVCIDIDASKPLPNSLPIKFISGKVVVVEFEYASKPLICPSCKTFGHLPSVCGNAPKNTKPKGNFLIKDTKVPSTRWQQVLQGQREENLVDLGENQVPTIVEDVDTTLVPRPKESNRFAALRGEDDDSLFGDEEEVYVEPQVQHNEGIKCTSKENDVEEVEKITNVDIVFDTQPQVGVCVPPALKEDDIEEVEKSDEEIGVLSPNLQEDDLEEGEWITPKTKWKAQKISPPNTRFKGSKIPTTLAQKRAKEHKQLMINDNTTIEDVPLSQVRVEQETSILLARLEAKEKKV